MHPEAMLLTLINSRQCSGEHASIIDIENVDFEALYFNEFDFYNHEEKEYQSFVKYQIDQNSLYK